MDNQLSIEKQVDSHLPSPRMLVFVLISEVTLVLVLLYRLLTAVGFM